MDLATAQQLIYGIIGPTQVEEILNDSDTDHIVATLENELTRSEASTPIFAAYSLYDVVDYMLDCGVTAISITKPETHKENTVNITHVTYLNNTNVETLTDNDLFQHIASLRAEEKRLKELNISGPAMDKAIKDLRAKAAELTDIVNARHTETDGPGTDGPGTDE